MKTTLLVVGRTVEQHFITAINDYIQRTRRYLSFDMEVIPELKNTKSLSMDVQKEKEGELILKALQPGDVVVLLDEGGKEMRSIEFADYMKRKMNTVNKRLVFIIGGPYGFSPKVYAAAHEKLSLSRMTFSHQMIRLYLRGAALPCHDDTERRTVSSRIIARKPLPAPVSGYRHRRRYPGHRYSPS